ncbi:MAG: hydroxymethylglutaryl-CoA synthase, partial [Thermocrispum sp.]
LDLFELAWENYREAAGATAFEDFSHVLYHTPVVPLVEQAHGLLVAANHPEAQRADHTESFERMVQPSLRYTRELGNTYSGSLWTTLAALVDHAPSVAAGERIGLYSYGSGSCAEFFSARFGPAARPTVAGHRLEEQLNARTTVSVAAYERIVLDTERSMAQAHFAPDLALVPGLYDDAYAGRGLLVLEQVREYYRGYRWS